VTARRAAVFDERRRHDVAAVIVDFHAGPALDDCVDSLHANGVTDIVVVENGEEGSTLPSLSGQHVVLVVPKLNLGTDAA